MNGPSFGGGTTVDPDGVLERDGLESRADIQGLEALQNKRRSLLAKHGRLLALHGQFGQWDTHRKRMIEALKVKARMELTASGTKVTDPAVEAAAYGSEEYGRFMDTALSEKIDCLGVQAELDDIAEQIRDREERMRFVRAEMGLR